MPFGPFGDPFRSLDRLASQLVSGARTPMGMPMDVWQGEDGNHESGNVLPAERPQGRFTRQLQVSDALDSANIAATYENGVLRLTIPMSQAAKPRRIEVRAVDRQQPVAVDTGDEVPGDHTVTDTR